jgi:methyltransferase family protein
MLCGDELLNSSRLFRLRTPRHWRRARRALAVVALVGLGVALAGCPVAGAVVFGMSLFALVLVEAARLRGLVVESERQQHALIQVRPLLAELPVDFTRWSADPILVHNAVRLLVETRPGLVLECGSGSSTIVVARCLRALGRGRVISLDHDPVYACRTRELLRVYGVDDLVSVVTAPLAVREADGQTLRWYGTEYEPLLTDSIDVLLVDGPPGPSCPRARYPAIPILKPHLAPYCAILLDDGDRPDERTIARAWATEIGATLSYLDGGRGGWLLRRLPPSP